MRAFPNNQREFYIDFFHLEVGDRIQLLALLGQRQEIADLAEIGIIFEADKSVLAEARAWCLCH
jgi:hypothetical protein